MNRTNPGCGVVVFCKVLRFETDGRADAGQQILAVAVPCVELNREAYSSKAGNAKHLKKGQHDRLVLEGPPHSGEWGKQVAWRAEKIDELGPSGSPARSERPSPM
jgi:hypothetical protein